MFTISFYFTFNANIRHDAFKSLKRFLYRDFFLQQRRKTLLIDCNSRTRKSFSFQDFQILVYKDNNSNFERIDKSPLRIQGFPDHILFPECRYHYQMNLIKYDTYNALNSLLFI